MGWTLRAIHLVFTCRFVQWMVAGGVVIAAVSQMNWGSLNQLRPHSPRYLRPCRVVCRRNETSRVVLTLNGGNSDTLCLS
jgi:hypothetical protein